MTIEKIYKDEFYAWLKYLRDRPDISKKDKKYLGEVRISVLYKCNLLAVKNDDGTIVAMLTYTVTKRYLNMYYRYTVPEMRGKHIYTEVLEWCKQHENFDRIYARASTLEAVAFYTSKQWPVRGIDKDGHLIYELHLGDDQRPLKAAKVAVKPVDKPVYEILQQPPFNYTIDQIRNYRII